MGCLTVQREQQERQSSWRSVVVLVLVLVLVLVAATAERRWGWSSQPQGPEWRRSIGTRRDTSLGTARRGSTSCMLCHCCHCSV